jgi:ankyrin repeat protein
MLLNAGANVDLQDKNGNTPLHAAAANGHIECVQLLVDHRLSAVVFICTSWKLIVLESNVDPINSFVSIQMQIQTSATSGVTNHCTTVPAGDLGTLCSYCSILGLKPTRATKRERCLSRFVLWCIAVIML